jgi:hypothetical protein
MNFHDFSYCSLLGFLMNFHEFYYCSLLGFLGPKVLEVAGPL